MDNNDDENIDNGSSNDIFNSILNSIKKMLGIYSDLKEFDSDIIMNINAAIFTLQQIGIGPSNLFIVEDEKQTYSDFLGEKSNLEPQVKMYLYYKCKLGFDPPQNSSILKLIEDSIKEAEWRLNIEVETFKKLDSNDDGGSDDVDPIKPEEPPLIENDPP